MNAYGLRLMRDFAEGIGSIPDEYQPLFIAGIAATPLVVAGIMYVIKQREKRDEAKMLSEGKLEKLTVRGSQE